MQSGASPSLTNKDDVEFLLPNSMWCKLGRPKLENKKKGNNIMIVRSIQMFIIYKNGI